MKPMYKPLEFTSYKVINVTSSKDACTINVKRGRYDIGKLFMSKKNDTAVIASGVVLKNSRLFTEADKREAVVLAGKLFNA
jgi:hypothetical protein